LSYYLAKYSLRPTLYIKPIDMRIRIIWGIIFCSLISITTPAGSATIPSSISKIIPVGDIYKRIASLKVKDIQKLIGRKLTLKEKISVFILKQKLRHKPKESANTGEIAFIFGIAGAALLLLSLFLPVLLIASFISAIVAISLGYITKKDDPGIKKARVARLLGWITAGLIAIFFIVIIIAFASIGSWSFG
jgi:hypothetical protein